MLARYASIRPHDTLAATLSATGSIWYVIRGAGDAAFGAERFSWGAGDVFLLPGGDATLSARADGAVLWSVGNDPQLAFDGSRPPPAAQALVQPVH